MIVRTKILLGSSVVFVVAGLIVSIALKPPIAPASYVLLPVGAILFGLFLTSRLLEKESVFFDEEKHAAEKSADQHDKTAVKKRDKAGG